MVGLFVWRALAILILVAAVPGSVILAATQIQVAASSVTVPGIVTAQEGFRQRGEHCVVELGFEFQGRQYNETFDTNSTCMAVPGPGSPVTLSVYPDDPRQHLRLIGHDGNSWSPWPAAVAAVLLIVAACIHLRWASSAYRQSRLAVSASQASQKTSRRE
jgi:hypothetical protein